MPQVYCFTFTRNILHVFLLSLYSCLISGQHSEPPEVSQPFYWQASKKTNSPLLVIITTKTIYQQGQKFFTQHRDDHDYNLLIIADTMEIPNYCQLVNVTLNEEDVNLKKVYLLGILTPDQQPRYQAVDHQIYAAQKWLDDFDDTTTSLESCWSTFNLKALWAYDVEKIQAANIIVERPNRIVRGIGFNLGTTSNQFKTEEPMEEMPAGLRLIGYEGFRQAHPRWLVNFSIDFGIQLPNPQKDLQSQIIEQIDISALLNGGEVEIKLDAVISGYFSAGVGIGLDYLLPTSKRNQPYVGMGLKFFGGSLFSGRIDTTIIFDNSNSFGGNGNDLDFRDNNDDFTQATFYFMTLSPKIGMYRKLNERWLFDLSAQYNVDPAYLKKETTYFNFLHLKMGLKYRFIGRATTRYEYLNVIAYP